MTPTHSKNGAKRYRYYVCSSAQKRGWDTCPSKSVPAGEIERVVVEQIKDIGQDPALVRATLAEAHAQGQARLQELDDERRGLERDVKHWNREVRELVLETGAGGDKPATARLADLQDRIGAAERRAGALHDEAKVLERELVDEQSVAEALAAFDPVWSALTPHEQARLIGQLVETVEYDGRQGKIAITFQPAGLRALADETVEGRKEQVA